LAFAGRINLPDRGGDDTREQALGVVAPRGVHVQTHHQPRRRVGAPLQAAIEQEGAIVRPRLHGGTGHADVDGGFCPIGGLRQRAIGGGQGEQCGEQRGG